MENSGFRIRPVTRKEARRVVAKWHSHHTAHQFDLFAIGGGQFFEAQVEVQLGDALEVVGNPPHQTTDDDREPVQHRQRQMAQQNEQAAQESRHAPF